MKRFCLSALAFACIYSANAQFIIEKNDASTTEVDGNVVFSEMSIGGVTAAEINSIYRAPYSSFTFEACDLAGKDNNISSVSSDPERQYTENGATFANSYYYGYYGGAAVSKASEISNWKSEHPGNCSNKKVITNDKTRPAGAGGSEKYCLLYYSTMLTDYVPGFEFAEGVSRKFRSVQVNNIADIWQRCKIGYYSVPGFAEDDYYEVIFTGYDASGEPTGSVKVAMADFRNGKSEITDEWTKVDLSAIGTAHKVVVTHEASAAFYELFKGEYGVCVDNICFE